MAAITECPPLEAALPKPGDLLTEAEAASILNVGRPTLSNWRSLKKGPRFCKIGGTMVRYTRADLAAFIAEGAGEEKA